jgi:hypothetical protein
MNWNTRVAQGGGVDTAQIVKSGAAEAEGLGTICKVPREVSGMPRRRK